MKRATVRAGERAGRRRGEKVLRRLGELLDAGVSPERAVVVAGVDPAIQKEVAGSIQRHLDELGEEGGPYSAKNF